MFMLFFAVALLTELYLAGVKTFDIMEVGKIVEVKVKRKEFVLSQQAKMVFAKIHDDWEMNMCKRFDNDTLVSGKCSPYFPNVKFIPITNKN